MADPPPLSPVVPSGGEQAWEELSPDGLTCVRWALSTGRMSHEIVTPALYDAATDEPLLLLDSGYDGQIRWLGEGRFTLSLRHYWRGGGATVEIDRGADTFRFLDPEPAEPEPIDRLSARIEARFTSTPEAAGPTGRGVVLRIVGALLLAVLAIVVLWGPFSG